MVAYQLRFNFSVPPIEVADWVIGIPFVLIVRAASFIIGKSYAGIIRYTSAKDAERIFVVILAGSVFFLLANQVSFYLISGKYIIPTTVVLIDFLASIFFLAGYRIAAKTLYSELTKNSGPKTNVLIFGAGEAGMITKRTLDRDAGTKYQVLAFVDDDRKKVGTKLEGVSVSHSNDLDKLLTEHNVESVIISVQRISPKRKAEVIEQCLAHEVKVLSVPPVNDWINGQLSFRQIRDIKVEDLLGREPIELEVEKIRERMKGRTILITGAAGSIGSELINQISLFEPKLLVLFDQAESPLYELELELLGKKKFPDFKTYIGSIQNEDRINQVFRENTIDIVYHAAAYKHVPLMENNPSEAIRDNVFGSKTLADAALKANVDEFVMVSTDKAVNPTNVMGASKRIAEIYTQSLNSKGKTKFITTRFGNVLGSTGSVIPLFKKQIENGGPLTVTDPEVTRYFMTIPEAAQLVLEASFMGQGGEIYVFDMGNPVKIDKLAKKMIKLYGLELEKDIQITYTGLRPGEKLYEELLTSGENTLPTHHPRIMIGKVREYPLEKIEGEIEALFQIIKQNDDFALVAKMKEIVPEFISNNSVFERLDKTENLTK